MNACRRFFPDASRRVCLVHLERNMKRKFNGPELVELMWGAANAYTDWEHEPFMSEIEAKCPAAYLWLMKEPKEYWCRHLYMSNTCTPDNTSNFVESFNNVIGELRDKPVLVLLEGIRKHIQKWVTERIKLSGLWTGKLVPSVVDKLKLLWKEAWNCNIQTSNGHMVFEVYDTSNGVKYIVNLNTRHCDCGYWMISGIPCKHAIRCIVSIDNATLEDYTSDFYTIERFRAAYGEVLNPIKDIVMWPKFNYPDLLPPLVVVKRGRRGKNRRRGPEEGRKKQPSRHTSVRCRTCKELHHNTTTCPLRVKNPIAKKKVKGGPIGRPRKEVVAARKATLEVEAQTVPNKEQNTRSKKRGSNKTSSKNIRPATSRWFNSDPNNQA